MGLSEELLQYAENVWRRFPEVFLSLGSPYFEDYFEMRDDGSWHQRVIDSGSAKVIEIRLPRRSTQREDASCDEGSQTGAWDQQEADPEDEGLLSAIDEIMQRVNDLDGRVAGHVKREMKQQLSSVGSLVEQWMGWTRQSNRGLPRATSQGASASHETSSFSLSTSSNQVVDSHVQQPAPPTQAPLKPLVSLLANRRGLQLMNVQTKGLGKEAPGRVIRRPDLDRVAGYIVCQRSVEDSTETSLTFSDVSQQATAHAEEEHPKSHMQLSASSQRPDQGSQCARNSEAPISPGDGLSHSQAACLVPAWKRGAQAPPLGGMCTVARPEFHSLGEGCANVSGQGQGARNHCLSQQRQPNGTMQQHGVHNISRKSEQGQDSRDSRSGRVPVHRMGDPGLHQPAWPASSGHDFAPSEGSTTALDMRTEQSPSGSAGEETSSASYNTHYTSAVRRGANGYRLAATGNLEVGSPVRQRRNMDLAYMGTSATTGTKSHPAPEVGFGGHFWQEEGRNASWRGAATAPALRSGGCP